jgi:methylenetetrahydrofolate--tRNA-(uracil-5-)-methyltransferase
VPDLEPEQIPVQWRNRKKLGKREKRPLLYARGIQDFRVWLESVGITPAAFEASRNLEPVS